MSILRKVIAKEGGSLTGAKSASLGLKIDPQAKAGVVVAAYPDPLFLVIDRYSTVVMNPDSPYPGSGTVTGNTITASYPAQNYNAPGLSCTGMVTGVGTLYENYYGGGPYAEGTVGPNTIYCNGTPFIAVGDFGVQMD